MNFPKTDYVNAKRLLTGSSVGVSSSSHENAKRLFRASSFESLEKCCISYVKAESNYSTDAEKAS
jgi:hypothetical protein